MDSPPPQARDPLSQPTRARLFALLAQYRRAVTTDELSSALELHPNGVRTHLERLEEAGLVTRRRVKHGRGRPRDEWTVAAHARPGGDPPHAYADLGRWLARAIPATPSGIADVERAGREIGRELAPAPGPRDSAPEVLTAALAAMGFEPEPDAPAAAGDVCVRLDNCPYRDAVKVNPAAVCSLHRGISQGLLNVLAPGARVTRFVPRDPDEAGCLVDVSGF